MALVVDLGEARPPDLVGIDTVTGEIGLYHQGQRVTPVRAFSRVAYDRPKGPKILSKADVNPQALS